MEAGDLLCDMEPQIDDDGKFFLSLSAEDGDTEDYVYFDIEAEAERVLNRVLELLDVQS